MSGIGVIVIALILIAAVVISTLFSTWTYKRVQGEAWKKVLLAVLSGVGTMVLCLGIAFAGCLAIFATIG